MVEEFFAYVGGAAGLVVLIWRGLEFFAPKTSTKWDDRALELIDMIVEKKLKEKTDKKNDVEPA